MSNGDQKTLVDLWENISKNTQTLSQFLLNYFRRNQLSQESTHRPLHDLSCGPMETADLFVQRDSEIRWFLLLGNHFRFMVSTFPLGYGWVENKQNSLPIHFSWKLNCFAGIKAPYQIMLIWYVLQVICGTEKCGVQVCVRLPIFRFIRVPNMQYTQRIPAWDHFLNVITNKYGLYH